MKSACCVCVCVGGLTFLYEKVFQYLFVGNIIENMKNKDHLVGHLTTFSYQYQNMFQCSSGGQHPGDHLGREPHPSQGKG